MCGTASAASGVLTVMRTSSDPASASSLTWIAVPIASTVSVLVIDWTRTGASPPTVTTLSPQRTLAWRLRRARGWAGAMNSASASRMSVMGNLLQFESGDVVSRAGREVERLAAEHQLGRDGVADLHAHRQRTV